MSFKLLTVMFTLLHTELSRTALGDWQVGVSCGLGEFYSHDKSGNMVCIPCYEGTFMPYVDHVITSCRPCTNVDIFSHENTIQECTATSDTVVGCDKGFYRRETGDKLLHRGDCYPCTICEFSKRDEFQARACSDKEDTICCPEPGMILAKELTNMGRHQCMHPNEDIKDTGPIVITQPDGSILRFGGCAKNEFMTSYNSGGNQAVFCKKCEYGIYIDEDNHMLGYCQPCTAKDGDIHLGCERGYNKGDTTDRNKDTEMIERNTEKVEEQTTKHDSESSPNTAALSFIIFLVSISLYVICLSSGRLIL